MKVIKVQGVCPKALGISQEPYQPKSAVLVQFGLTLTIVSKTNFSVVIF